MTNPNLNMHEYEALMNGIDGKTDIDPWGSDPESARQAHQERQSAQLRANAGVNMAHQAIVESKPSTPAKPHIRDRARLRAPL